MGEPESISGPLAELARGLGLPEPVAASRLFGSWSEIVGEAVASRSRPVSLRKGELRVITDSAAWAAQLRYLAPEVIRRVNEALGRDLVRNVTATVRPEGLANKQSFASDEGPSRAQEEREVKGSREKGKKGRPPGKTLPGKGSKMVYFKGSRSRSGGPQSSPGGGSGDFL